MGREAPPPSGRQRSPVAYAGQGSRGSSLSMGRSGRCPEKNQRAGGFLVLSCPPHPRLSGPARHEAVLSWWTGP